MASDKIKESNRFKKAWGYLSTHGLGMRSLKTVIAMSLCLLLALLVDYKEKPFYACISAIIVMQNTTAETAKTGIARVMGTLIGGVIGMLMVPLIKLSGNSEALLYIMLPFGVLISIVFCNVVNFKKASSISAIVLLSLLLADANSNLYQYLTARIIETLIGAVIATIVNFAIKPRRDNNLSGGLDTSSDSGNSAHTGKDGGG